MLPAWRLEQIRVVCLDVAGGRRWHARHGAQTVREPHLEEVGCRFSPQPLSVSEARSQSGRRQVAADGGKRFSCAGSTEEAAARGVAGPGRGGLSVAGYTWQVIRGRRGSKGRFEAILRRHGRLAAGVLALALTGWTRWEMKSSHGVQAKCLRRVVELVLFVKGGCLSGMTKLKGSLS